MDSSENLSIGELQEKYPYTLILRLRGNFYQSFDDSAFALSAITGYKLRHRSKNSLYTCGFPCNALDKVMGLIQKAKINHIVFDAQEIVVHELYDDNSFVSIVSTFDSVKDSDIEAESVCNDEKDTISAVSSVKKQYVKFYECSGTDQTSAYIDLQNKIDLELSKGSSVAALSFQKNKEKKDALKRFVLSGIVIYER